MVASKLSPQFSTDFKSSEITEVAEIYTFLCDITGGVTLRAKSCSLSCYDSARGIVCGWKYPRV